MWIVAQDKQAILDQYNDYLHNNHPTGQHPDNHLHSYYHKTAHNLDNSYPQVHRNSKKASLEFQPSF